jgi:hypothetical protein
VTARVELDVSANLGLRWLPIAPGGAPDHELPAPVEGPSASRPMLKPKPAKTVIGNGKIYGAEKNRGVAP